MEYAQRKVKPSHVLKVCVAASPNEDEYYMMSSIDAERKYGKTSFASKDAMELDDEEIKRLESGLFNACSSAMAIIHKGPTPLKKAQQPNKLGKG